MSSRASTIAAAGMVLSQPTRITSPSKRLPRATSSIESAMTSRLTSDARMPADPIVMPSEIETVLNSIGVPPAARTPSLSDAASSRRCRLHGPISVQVLAMPMIGRASASRSNPAARSIDRAPARLGPSVIAPLCHFPVRFDSMTPTSYDARRSPLLRGPMRGCRRHHDHQRVGRARRDDVRGTWSRPDVLLRRVGSVEHQVTREVNDLLSVGIEHVVVGGEHVDQAGLRGRLEAAVAISRLDRLLDLLLPDARGPLFLDK